MLRTTKWIVHNNWMDYLEWLTDCLDLLIWMFGTRTTEWIIQNFLNWLVRNWGGLFGNFKLIKQINGLFRIANGIVHTLWMDCSNLLMDYSESQHWLFWTCEWMVQILWMDCSESVHSKSVNGLFRICEWIVLNLWINCSEYVNELLRICEFIVLNLWIECSEYVN